jgi:putative ABC transport system permease protein
VYLLTWLWGLLRRRTIRLAGAVTGIAIAVALVGSLGAFFAASKAHMTKQAASSWTGRCSSRQEPTRHRPPR